MMNIPGLLSDEEKQGINNGAMLNAALALLGNRGGRGLAGAANAVSGGLGAYGQAQAAGVNDAIRSKQMQSQMEEAQQKKLMQQRLGEMFASTTDAPESKFNAYMNAANLAAAQGNSEAAKRYAEIAQQFKLKEEEGYSLSPGQVRYKGNQQVAAVPAEPAKPPSAVQEYEFAKNQGFAGTFEQWELAKRKASAPSVAVNTSDPTAVAKFGLDLQGKVRDAFKGDNTIAQQYRAMQNAVENPSAKGDTALLYSFFKVLDPESTVREGELAMVQASRSIPDQFKGYAQRLATGQTLTPAERADLLNQAGSQVRARMSRADSEVKSFRDAAKTIGLDPQQYVPNPYEGLKFEAQTGKFDKLPKPADFAGRKMRSDAGITYRSDGTKWIREGN